MAIEYINWYQTNCRIPHVCTFLYTQVANHLHMKLLHMDRHHCTSSNLSPQLPGNTHDPTLGPASQLDERKTCSWNPGSLVIVTPSFSVNLPFNIDPLTAPCAAKAASEICWDADPRSPDHLLGKDLSLGLQSGLHPEILRLGNNDILTAEVHQFSRGMSYDIWLQVRSSLNLGKISIWGFSKIGDPQVTMGFNAKTV